MDLYDRSRRPMRVLGVQDFMRVARATGIPTTAAMYRQVATMRLRLDAATAPRLVGVAESEIAINALTIALMEQARVETALKATCTALSTMTARQRPSRRAHRRRHFSTLQRVHQWTTSLRSKRAWRRGSMNRISR